ncbi:hypothetical protein [Hymenobacter metallicola]|uniref:Uncharacterized protein n=1 Tax=Hymenobacter metallicola TaxID=2563114 RepID=A0A4Z0QFX2_9BACT|nr:hypothetical protein [Hymenobacter metallicola]TGE28654.1 hypothetical protein E5K02_04085 [Hymenobacter metallicola]
MTPFSSPFSQPSVPGSTATYTPGVPLHSASRIAALTNSPSAFASPFPAAPVSAACAVPAPLGMPATPCWLALP